MAGVRIHDIVSFRVPPRWIFVRVGCDDGSEGWGEAIVPGRVTSVEGAIQDLAANVVGAEADRIEDLWQGMHRDAFFRGGPILGTAAAAIEIALWDAKGRRNGLAVHQFLGGPVRERTRCYAWVGGDQPADVVAQTRRRIEQGFNAVKMNAAGALDYLEPHSAIAAVVERVDSLRREFGSDLGIAVDFHGRANHVTARTLLRELEPYGLLWVEEPVSPESDDTLRDIRRVAGATPIATGERLISRWQVKQLLADGTVDILQPDVSLTGLFELEKICRMAEAYDVAVAPHSPNGPISLAASLQVGFCCGNVVIQEQSLGMHYHLNYAGLPAGDLFDYLTDPAPLQSHDSYFHRFDGPGLGITVDADAVAARAQDWHAPDPGWRHPDGRRAEW
ncbi:MAG TPA: galactonate dehydratase [Thermomicrobiaceae bacterium]|nr:galactonate dehydratase [Thermomicrobiaceae bacterium]